MMFKKASKKQLKARVALVGPAGSGKTYSALLIARHLGTKIAVIDTERGSASKYSGDVADFDVCELDSFAPRSYIAALHGAASGGYDVVVIDSLSHAWEGAGGILDQVDSRGGKFEAWKDMSPQLRDLVEAVLRYPGHVIATLRTKTEYVVEEREYKGKMRSVPRKVGLAPKFKEGLEYEFDVVGTLDEGILTISKSRCSALSDASIKHPGRDFAITLRTWLDDGSAPAPQREQRERRDETPALSEGLSESELAVCAMLRDQMPTMAAGELRDAWTSLSRGQRAEVARTMDPRHKRALWDAITSEQRDELRGMK